MEHGFNWLVMIPGVTWGNLSAVTAVLIGIGLILAGFAVKAQLAGAGGDERLLPDPRLSLRNFFEMATEMIHGLSKNIIGHHSERYVPLLATIFLYILFMNFIGLVPGFLPPSGDLDNNVAIAVIVFLYYNFMGIKETGFVAYMKHLAGPVIWLAPLIFVIELVGHFFRPVSLSLRLFGNMNGDHMVVGIFSELVPLFVPVIFLCLGILISIIQAFVFTVLSAVYIGLAVAEDH